MPRLTLIALFFSLCLFGCSSTTKPVVWKSNDIIFSDFQYFDVQPVANATGHTLMQDIPGFLTDSLKQTFIARNLQVVDGQQTGSDVMWCKARY